MVVIPLLLALKKGFLCPSVVLGVVGFLAPAVQGDAEWVGYLVPGEAFLLPRHEITCLFP